jgi:predicted small secreted protein
MKTAMRRALALACCAATLTLAACSTVEGLGKDIQKGGEKLEGAAK